MKALLIQSKVRVESEITLAENMVYQAVFAGVLLLFFFHPSHNPVQFILIHHFPYQAVTLNIKILSTWLLYTISVFVCVFSVLCKPYVTRAFSNTTITVLDQF